MPAPVNTQIEEALRRQAHHGTKSPPGTKNTEEYEECQGEEEGEEWEYAAYHHGGGAEHA